MSYNFEKTNILKEFIYILYNLRLQYLNSNLLNSIYHILSS